MDILQLLLEFFTSYGYVAVFIVLVLCGFGLPVPEDVTLVAGGIISGLGYTNVHWMFLVGMAGVLIGDCAMFTLGRVYGSRILHFRPFRKILTQERFEAVQEKFDKYGNWVLFVARFLPGLRSPIFVTAGMTRRVSYFRFFVMDGLAAVISVPVWIYLGDFGASNIDELMHWVHQGQIGILSVIGIGFVIGGVLLYRKRQKKRVISK